MKKVFCYDYAGKYIGQAEAELCPLTETEKQAQLKRGVKEGEKAIESVALLPAFSTEIEPQSIEGHEAFFSNGEWVYKEIEKLKEDSEPEVELTYAQKRVMEYPSIYDYIDGVVKGDTEQVEKYVKECLAIKAKYPKPKVKNK